MKKPNFLTFAHNYLIDQTQILGEGSTGQVYLGKQLSSNRLVAVKVIRLETIDNQVTQYLLKMQKIALRTLCHQNVVEGLKIIENPSKCYIITEYCNGGTLKQLIKKYGCLNEQTSLEIMKALLKGQNALLKKNIIHRDMKPANIIFHNNIPKIIDFGYCQILGYQKPSLDYNVGSPSYMAPQSFENNIYNQKTEIWAIGVILYECLMGKTFDDGKHMSQVFKAIKKYGIPFAKSVSEKCRKIIKWCLNFAPSKRPAITELLAFLNEKKTNQTEFFMLEKNRAKTNSLFLNPISYLSGDVTVRIDPAVQIQRKISSALQPKKMTKKLQERKTKRQLNQQQFIMMGEYEITEDGSESNSQSKQQFEKIVKKSNLTKKVESIPCQLQAQRLVSNQFFQGEYGMSKGQKIKISKYLPGQNVHNKLPNQNFSGLLSSLTSPRQHVRKQSQANDFLVQQDKYSQSGKRRVEIPIAQEFMKSSAKTRDTFYDKSSATTYRPMVSNQSKISDSITFPIRKQNFELGFMSKQIGAGMKHFSQYNQHKAQPATQGSLMNFCDEEMKEQRPKSIWELEVDKYPFLISANNRDRADADEGGQLEEIQKQDRGIDRGITSSYIK